MKDTSEKETDDVYEHIFARFKKICVNNADDPMVKATIQTLNDTKVVVNEEE